MSTVGCTLCSTKEASASRGVTQDGMQMLAFITCVWMTIRSHAHVKSIPRLCSSQELHILAHTARFACNMKDCNACSELELLQAEGKAQREPEVTLNYEHYYPTLLPMRQPGMEETDAEAHARDDRPPDLSLHQVECTMSAISLTPCPASL